MHYTRKQIAKELGISKSTFYRKLREEGIELKKGLVTDAELEDLKRIFRRTYLRNKKKDNQ